MRVLLLGVLLTTTFWVQAEPIGTAFTYQGELNQQNMPANGSYDFKFELYDAQSNGSPVTTAIELENVAVSNGIFTVELDFGESTFTSEQHWLELSVREGASAAAHVVLTPRQVITPTPYAIRALKVFDRVVVVSGAHDPLENGVAALEAVAFIQNQGPSETDPWLIQLEPGTFDIGGGTLQLPDYVSLIGSGTRATTLESQSQNTVILCSYCTVENLTVSNESSVTPEGSSTLYGIQKQDVHLQDLVIEYFHQTPGEVATGEHAAVRFSDSAGVVRVSQTRIEAGLDATGGNLLGLHATGTGSSSLLLKDVEISVEGTGSVYAAALDLREVKVDAEDIKLNAIADTNEAIGMAGQGGGLSDGRFIRSRITASSNQTARGVALTDAHSLDFSDLEISVDAQDARAFEVHNESEEIGVGQIAIRNSKINSLGYDSRGIVFKPYTENPTQIALLMVNSDVVSICDDDGSSYALEVVNDQAEQVAVLLERSSFTSLSETNSALTQGIRLESTNARLNMSRSEGIQFSVVINSNAQSVPSNVIVANGVVSSSQLIFSVNGPADVSLLNSSATGASLLQNSGASVTCSGITLNGVFTASGC